MAVYDASGNVLNLNKVHSFATDTIRKTLHATLYRRVPIVSIFAGRQQEESMLGRPGSFTLLGGKPKYDAVEKTRESGVTVQVRHLTASGVSTIKTYGAESTSPSMGTDSQVNYNASASFRWTGPIAASIRVPKQIVRAAMEESGGSDTNAAIVGKRIADPLKQAVEQATHDLVNNLNLQLWRGVPTSQSADVWDSTLGIVQALDVDNVYGNVTRTSASHWFASNRVTTAGSASLNLIDQAGLGTGLCSSIGKPLDDYGQRPDLWIVSNAIYYTLKQEALARGGAIQLTDMPEMSKVGQKYECIKYGNATIIADPTLTGDWSAAATGLTSSSVDSDITDATKVMIGLNTEDWVFSISGSDNFAVSKFVDQAEANPGGDDALTAVLTVRPRFYCRRPQRQIIFTNISA